MMQTSFYATRALAESHSIDEVKNIKDKAAALQLYAKQANRGRGLTHRTVQSEVKSTANHSDSMSAQSSEIRASFL